MSHYNFKNNVTAFSTEKEQYKFQQKSAKIKTYRSNITIHNKEYSDLT